jgi:hypothetical protein
MTPPHMSRFDVGSVVGAGGFLDQAEAFVEWVGIPKSLGSA